MSPYRQLCIVMHDSRFTLSPCPPTPPITIATRGSALALAQANLVLAQCRAAFPKLSFELKIIKTTGDKLQTASLAQEGKSLPKGLFTKELEVALLKHRADLAVHSLKDLPTELPAGLTLGAVGKRADVRDVLIYRDADYLRAAEADKDAAEWSPGQSARRGFKPGLAVKDLPAGAVVATSSTRRKAQLLTLNPGLKVPDIRGNVVTRMQKLAERAELDATVLALAGLTRLNFRITPEGRLEGDAVPDGLLATVLDTEVMLPCVGQGAVGIEVRAERRAHRRHLRAAQPFQHPAMRHRGARLSRRDGRRLPKPGRGLCRGRGQPAPDARAFLRQRAGAPRPG